MLRRGVLLLVLLAFPRAARADPQVDSLVEQARREKAALRYQEGLVLLDRALRLGRAGRADLIAIYRLAGELAAGIDDSDAAAAHFRRLLALSPDAVLPEGTSPKVTSPFAIAAADIHARGPLTEHSDPFHMVAGRRDGKLVDRFGNVLLEATPAAPTLPPRTGRGRVIARWWPWAIAAVVLAAGTTWAGLTAQSAQAALDDIAAGRRDDTYVQAQAIERRGRRAALLANIGFAVTGATAAVSLFFYFRAGAEPSTAIVSVAARF